MSLDFLIAAPTPPQHWPDALRTIYTNERPEDSEPFEDPEKKRPADGAAILAREVRLYEVLALGGMWTAVALAERTGYGKSTIHGDLGRMRKKGQPIRSKNGYGFWLERTTKE